MTKNYENHIILNAIDCNILETRVYCFRCGADVSKFHLFCAKCGIKIHKGVPTRKTLLDIDQKKQNRKICFVCGTDHAQSDKFCTNCGIVIK